MAHRPKPLASKRASPGIPRGGLKAASMWLPFDSRMVLVGRLASDEWDGLKVGNIQLDTMLGLANNSGPVTTREEG